MWCRFLRQLCVRSSYDIPTTRVVRVPLRRRPWGVLTGPRRYWCQHDRPPMNGCRCLLRGRVSTSVNIGRMNVVATALKLTISLDESTRILNQRHLEPTALISSHADQTVLQAANVKTCNKDISYMRLWRFIL